LALSIPITGVAIDYRVPGAYAEILFNQGPASASAGVREVVFVMPKLSTGSGTANVLYKLNSAKDAEDLAGAGSPAHRAVRKFMSINKDAKCWLVLVAETSGGSPASGTGTVVFATTPTATGTASVWVCGEESSYTYKTTDTVTTIGDGIAAAINAKSWLPVTAANVTGTVTLTAKLKGVSQGTAALGVIRLRASTSTGTGTTVTASTHIGAVVAGADGTTTEAANLATALAALDSVRKYYIVSSANDATSLGNLKSHISTKSEPRRGLRSVGITGFTGSLAQAQTIAIARNYERLQIAWQKNSDNDSAEIAAVVAAIRQAAEQVDSAANLAGKSLSDMLYPAYSTSDWPTGDDQNDAINDGITPIATNDAGPYLVMSVNTRSKNSAGTQDDFRSTETHRVSVADEFVDELIADWNLNFAGKKFASDETLADGTVNPNQSQIRDVIRPSTYAPRLKAQMDRFAQAGKIDNVAASKASVRCLKTGSRLECSFDIEAMPHLHQGTFRVAEVSQG
jgi:phage tail sheath gpL-like